MIKANGIMLWWQTQEWMEEARGRRLMDVLGWMEFLLRQLVAGLNPHWVTEGCYIGLIVDRYFKDTVAIRIQLTKMGAPVREISLAEHKPPLTILPPGAWELHPSWIRYMKYVKKNQPDLDPEKHQHILRIQHLV
jgi:hypothetical protein